MTNVEHLALAKKISALDIGRLSREQAFEKLTPLLAGLDALDIYAILMFARVAVEPRKADDETLAHLRAAMKAIQFRSAI